MPNSSCHFLKHKSVFLQTLHQSSVSLNITALYFFSSNIIYFVKSSSSKSNFLKFLSTRVKSQFLRFLSAQVKNLYIPRVNFELTSQFVFKFCITLQCYERKLLCAILAQTLYTLVKRSPLKCKFLRLLSDRVKTSLCQFWNDKPIPLQFFHHSSVSLHINSSGTF